MLVENIVKGNTMANTKFSTSDYIARIKELESQLLDLREREKIIQAIQDAQEDILNKTTVLVAIYVLSKTLRGKIYKRMIWLPRLISGLLRRLYGKLLSRTLVGKFYRKQKKSLKKYLKKALL